MTAPSAGKSTSLLLALLFVAGCSGNQASFDSAGPQAGRIERLWWLFFWVSVMVYTITMSLILLAVWRKRRSVRRDTPEAPEIQPAPAAERRLATAVGAGVAVTILILFVLLFGDFVTGRRIHALSSSPAPLTIKLTSHQWWWEAQYQDTVPRNIFITANEIHIPVGKPIRIELHTADVIHSFWVPNLHGKKDMIPGHPTAIHLQADRPGIFSGQCAEFCGYQHAKMRLLVIAEPEAEFNAWLARQREPAANPQTELQRRGQQVFLSSQCIMCHTIRGTHAASRVGPELTHLASRRTIAANTLPNVPGHLAGWILDPQKIKPGVRMTPNLLSAEDLHALLEYLSSLE